MHNGYRPLVLSYIMSKVTDSRLKTHEIMLGATSINLRDRELFHLYSTRIRTLGSIVPYAAVDSEGLEVTLDPVASAVARYSARREGRSSNGPALQSLLPVCFCNSQCSDIVSGGVMWIQCENAESCVSFRHGWAHQACALPRGRAVPESWTCPGCETGAPPVLTRVAAGGGLLNEVRVWSSYPLQSHAITCHFSRCRLPAPYIIHRHRSSWRICSRSSR